MRNITMVAILVACGQPEPQLPQPTYVRSPALAAMQDSKFDVALREANVTLARDPRDSQAAGVRAIARYQQAGSQLFSELGAVVDAGERLDALDHERGRAAWLAFLGALEAIDRDLEVAAADPSFALELCVACLESDWNRNGRIDDRDRKLFELELDGNGGELAENDPRRRPTYRFDQGDALWARAMVQFQRAGVEVVLAYRWSELDKLFRDTNSDRINIAIKLVDPGRVKRARELVLAGLSYAEQTRDAYLKETDDDREWLPNPKQKNYAMPLPVDAALFATWATVLGDIRRLLESKEGISLREVALATFGTPGASDVPNAYVDLGRLLREPTDIVFDLDDKLPRPQMYERLLRGLLGRGYAESMRASPLVGRLRHMASEVARGTDTVERKLRYLLWLN
ncbi:MAG TPA: hypothetical protein VIV11_35110 [Kofleriaceae bacterium]